MKLIEIIMAAKSIAPVMRLELPYKLRRQIKDLYRAIEKEYIDYSEEELNLCKKHAVLSENGMPQFEKGTNKIIFKTAEDKIAYSTAINEINNTEIEWKHPIIEISEKDLNGQTISVQTEIELEQFITFKE